MASRNGISASRKTFFRVALACLLALLPMTVLAAPPAQDGAVDPVVADAVQQSARIVFASVGGSAGMAASSSAEEEPEVEEPVVEEPVVEEPVSDAPEEEPRLAPEEVTIGAETEVDTGAISVLYPDTWSMEIDDFSGLPAFTDSASGLEVQMMDAGGEFPGLLVFPILEGNGQLMLDSMGANATLVSMSRFTTDDGLPVLRIEYADAENPDGEIVSGALFFIATGGSAYGVMAAVGNEYWPVYADAVDFMVESLLVDEANITLGQAGADGEVVQDAQGLLSLTVPADWYFSSVEGAELGLSVADADVSVVGALLATQVDSTSDEMEVIADAIAGAADSDGLDDILEEIVGALQLGAGEEMVVDRDATAVFPASGENIGTLRLVSEFQMEDGPSLPLSLYLSIFPDTLTAFIVFGDIDAVAAQEATILEMIGTIAIAE
jgi:hypothetical protein